MITAVQLIQDQIKDAHETFINTVSTINSEDLHKLPGGKALPLGSLVAHLAYSEDVIIHGMLQGKPPLYTTVWKGKTGVNEPMPAMDEKWKEAHEKWARSVNITFPELLAYVKALFAGTEKYVSTLRDVDLEKEIDLGSWGKKRVVDLLSGFITAHTNSLTGEIAAVKGVHGAQGYPF